MPAENEAKYIASKFEEISHIPQIIDCIDGSHIPILAPENGFRNFVNRKGWPSYVLQAVGDHNCWSVNITYYLITEMLILNMLMNNVIPTFSFRSISCKSPGSTHDALVFKNSGLYKYNDQLNPKVKFVLLYFNNNCLTKQNLLLSFDMGVEIIFTVNFNSSIIILVK